MHKFCSRLTLLLILFFLIFSISAVFAAGETIKVGVFNNPPKVYLEENKSVSGIYAAVLDYVAKKEDWNIEYINGTFQENLEALDKNKIDILVDVAYTEERAQYLEYNNESVLISYGVVFTRPDFNPISFRELDGKKIATLEGSSFLSEEGYPEIERLLGIKSKIIPTPSYDSAFLLLKTGAVDAVIANDVYGYYDKKIHPDSEYIFTDLLFLPRNQFFAFPKNGSLNKQLIEKIDSNLIELKKDRTSIYYQEIYEMQGGYKERVFTVPLWAKLIIVFITLILIISLIFTFILNKQKRVIKKSKEIIEIERNKLESANRLKDLFIDIMRHDLLNSASVINMNVQLALESKTVNQKKVLSTAFEGSNKLIGRIKDASLISKLEEGKEAQEYNKTNLKAVINNVLKETDSLASQNRIKLISRINEDYFVKASPLIYDVFLNLITNAIKYSPKRTEVIIDLVKKHSKYQVYVKDNGEGIPDKYKKSIFERFTRLEKGAIKGSGLGLAITKKIIELHKGKVWVENNPKGGSIFIVELPTSGDN